MFVTLRGEPYLLWRAVDQHGAELDVLVQKRRDKVAAKRLFKRVLAACPETPRKIVTDQLRSYPAAKAEIAQLADVRRVFVKASARVNNRAENSHQPTHERERRMRGFRRPVRTQSFLSSFGPIRQHFALKRHLLRASLYRKQLIAQFEYGAFSQAAPKIRPSHSGPPFLPVLQLGILNVTKPCTLAMKMCSKGIGRSMPTPPIDAFSARDSLLIEVAMAIAVRDAALPDVLQTALLNGLSPEQIRALIVYVSTRVGDPKVAVHAASAALHLAGSAGPEGRSESSSRSGGH